MRRCWHWKDIGLALGLLGAAAAGCDRGKSGAAGNAGSPSAEAIEPSTPKPQYSFAPGLEVQHPDVVRFLRHFIETALAGDYAGYRRLVSRSADPESRGRFEKVLNSLAQLAIESIEETRLPVAPQAYRVVAAAELRPEAREALRRRGNNRIAILVFEEEGEFRTMLAPPELQPATREAAEPASPPSTAPDYPWQRDGDY